MLSSIFHDGSGLGDQLFRFITSKTIAQDRGFVHGMLNGEKFKGKSFISLPSFDIPSEKDTLWFETDLRDSIGIDRRSYDPEINFVEDNTIIDGCFEDEKYWGHRISEIREWLKVVPRPMLNNVCAIGFRGGEYAAISDLFLTKDYWKKAMAEMKLRYPGIQFEVHTDDAPLAKQFFPDYPICAQIDLNWRAIRYAKHLIVANSAFYIMPMLIGNAEDIIAPRYWARRNLKIWARPACFYKDKRITYI